jgi:6-phosphogluconolactonase
VAEPLSAGASRVRRFPEAESLAQAAAAEIAARLSAAAAPFGLVLAGGSTPKRTYEVLATKRPAAAKWTSVSVWFGDERCVPPDHADSNFAMAKAALLDRAGPFDVHRVLGERHPQEAADDYERRLRAESGASPRPPFDLVLLGMGEDGHTASLFPGHPALAETSRWAVAVETEAKAPRWRVTLTIPALAAADEVWFLVTGVAKRAVLAEILRDPVAAASRYPAAGVASRARRVVWFADAAALT